MVGGGLNGVFVAVSNKAYGKLAEKLNQRENHRTPTAYYDALIIKTMFFQFINSCARAAALQWRPQRRSRALRYARSPYARVLAPVRAAMRCACHGKSHVTSHFTVPRQTRRCTTLRSSRPTTSN
jgi:hypothetical protein